MANIDDKFIKSVMAPPTKLSSSMSASSDVVTVESMDGWVSDTAVLAAIDRVDSLGNLTPDKMEIVLGVISETGLFNVKRGIGGNIQSHSAGSVVELSIAGAEQWNRLIMGILNSHNQDGTLKAGSVKSEMIAEKAVRAKNIDFETFEKTPTVDFAYAAGRIITYTPKFDCSATVEFTAHGWGYGGEFLRIAVSQTSGDNTNLIYTSLSQTQGGDMVKKPIISKAIFGGLKKGKTYTFGISAAEGRIGSLGDEKMLIQAFPEIK